MAVTDLNYQYDFRRIGLDNLSDIAGLVEKVSRKRQSLERYRKKYLTPWSSGRPSGWIAIQKSSGIPVAFYAALHLYCQFPDGSHAPITQFIDSFTLQEHRGKGLMSYMMEMILQEHRQCGTAFFFGLANPNSHGFLKKMNFRHIETMNYFKLKINTLPLEAICRRFRILQLSRWWIRKVFKQYNITGKSSMDNSAIGEGHGGVLHNRQFFEYKSMSFNQLCTIAGIDCWLKFDTGLLIGDVILEKSCTEDKFNEWIKLLKRLAAYAGLHQILFQADPRSILGRKLASRMKPNPSFAVFCKAEGEVDPSKMNDMVFCYGDYDSF